MGAKGADGTERTILMEKGRGDGYRGGGGGGGGGGGSIP